MPEFRVSKAAVKDIFEIGQHTEFEWGIKKRNEYLDDLEQRFIMLAEDPNSVLARSRDDIKIGIYTSIINKHIIIFRKFEYGIRIVRVLHQATDYSRQLK